MSELKAFVARKIDDGSCDPVPCIEVYLKSEADKAIADLEESHKKEVEQLIMEIVRLKDKQKTEVKELRHHKYKRCLAVARRCHNESLWWYSKGYGFEKYDKFWEKWEKRWLELANKYKYKEAK